MRWSWKLGRVAGIDLRVHATFLLLLAWLALAFHRTDGARGAAVGVLFTLAIFTSVVLHELGHAIAARSVGVPTRDITLLPIGGVARLQSIPRNPRHELRIALAGPAVTVVIAVALFGVLRVLGASTALPRDPGAALDTGGAFLAQLMWTNVWLLAFNLLPAFPMDGGRVLRALLALRMDYGRATELAARIGRGFALLFGVVGLLYNPFLVLIALFVWLGAASEAATVQLRVSLVGVPLERVMIRDIRTLAPDDTMAVALDHVLAGFQQDFPVVDRGRVVGMLTRAAMLRSVARHGRDALVADAMDRSVPSAELREPLEGAVARLMESRVHAIPVVEAGQLRGVLTLDNIGEFVMIETALRTASSGGHSPPRAGAEAVASGA